MAPSLPNVSRLVPCASDESTTKRLSRVPAAPYNPRAADANGRATHG
jgi:hypothetical protein